MDRGVRHSAGLELGHSSPGKRCREAKAWVNEVDDACETESKMDHPQKTYNAPNLEPHFENDARHYDNSRRPDRDSHSIWTYIYGRLNSIPEEWARCCTQEASLRYVRTMGGGDIVNILPYDRLPGSKTSSESRSSRDGHNETYLGSQQTAPFELPFSIPAMPLLHVGPALEHKTDHVLRFVVFHQKFMRGGGAESLEESNMFETTMRMEWRI